MTTIDTTYMEQPEKGLLFKMIKEGDEAQNRAIQTIWKKTDYKCRNIVRKGRGNQEDLEDTRQEATILTLMAIRKNTFRGSTNGELVAFFNQTFLYVWMAKIRKRDKLPLTELNTYSTTIEKNVEDALIQLETQTIINRKLEHCLKKLDDIGKKIISWRYFEKPPVSWEIIAQRLGYQTTQAAQNKGGKGMKKLRICMDT